MCSAYTWMMVWWACMKFVDFHYLICFWRRSIVCTVWCLTVWDCSEDTIRQLLRLQTFNAQSRCQSLNVAHTFLIFDRWLNWSHSTHRTCNVYSTSHSSQHLSPEYQHLWRMQQPSLHVWFSGVVRAGGKRYDKSTRRSKRDPAQTNKYSLRVVCPNF